MLGVLILLALGALVGGLIAKSGGGGRESPAAGASAAYDVTIPATGSAEIAGATIDDGRLVVRLSGAAGDELVVMDPATGRVLGRVRVAPNATLAP